MVPTDIRYDGAMSVPGQSRPGRADSRSGRVRYAPIATDFAVQPNIAMCHKGTCGELNSAIVILNADTL